MNESVIELLISLADRFHGVDLQCRRGGTEWPHRWRARLFSTKNERDEYRLTAYGDTPDAATLRLQIMVNNIKL